MSCHGQGINVFKHGVEVVQPTHSAPREDPLRQTLRYVYSMALSLLDDRLGIGQ